MEKESLDMSPPYQLYDPHVRHVKIEDIARLGRRLKEGAPERPSAGSIADGSPVSTEAIDCSSLVMLIAQKNSPTLTDLHVAGFRASAVSYTEFSVEAINTLLPKVIILDLSVPIHVALALGDFIKGNRAYRDIPVLMLLKQLSDYPLPTRATLRPDLSLIEPFTLSELRAGVNFLLQPKEARRKAPRDVSELEAEDK
jgi:PleD family two-component response regulator